MRLPAVIFLAALLGCTDAPTGPAAERPTGGPQSAFFDTYPDRLFAVATLACTSPGEELVRAGPQSLRCETLPPPGAAADLILRYDGSVQDLPRFISSVDAVASRGGYLVTLDSYIRVPRKTGPATQIRLASPRLVAMRQSLLKAAGGSAVAEP